MATKGNARSSGYVRNAHDWYRESAECVDKMLAVEDFPNLRTVDIGPPTVVLDPCCGSGNIPQRLLAHGIPAIGIDLMDRGFEYPTGNFLDMRARPHSGIAHCVMNPPFQMAQKFVEHALRTVPGKVVIIQRLAFLAGQARGRFFAESGLSHVWVHSSRVSMPPGGADVPAQNGSVEYAWFVWRRGPVPVPYRFTGGLLP